MKTLQIKQQTDTPFQTKMKNQGTHSSILQAYKDKAAQLQPTKEEELLQGKLETVQKIEVDEEEPVQGKFETTQLATEEEEPLQRQPNNTGLPDNLKSGIENMSGYSMDDVKVHYNSSQPATLQAHAYAQGTDIHVAPGQEKHVPHEAWHVVQQKQGRVKPTRQMKGTVPVNDDAGLEKEADVMGAKANSIKYSKYEASNINNNGIIQNQVVQRGRITNFLFGLNLAVSKNIPSYVYRVDRRPLDKLLNGFQPNQVKFKKNYLDITYDDLESYTKSKSNNPGLISTSEDKQSALDFGHKTFFGETFYIYKIKTTNLRGFDINNTLWFWDNRFANQKEISIYDDIPSEQIELEGKEVGTGVESDNGFKD